MRPRHEIDPALSRLAHAQSGVLSREQALALGMTDDVIRRLLREDWRAAGRGLYVLGSEPPSFRQRAWIGVLAGGDRATVGGEGALHLGDLRPEPTDVLVWIEPGRRPRSAHGVWFRRDGEGRPTRSRGTLRRLRPEDAVVDLAEELDVEGTAALLADVLRSPAVSAESLRRTLSARSRHARRGELQALLDDIEGVESHLEFVFRRDVVRAHGLPEGVLQKSLAHGTRSDVWFEEYGVVVELDGRRGHEGKAFRDLHRDNRLAVRAQTTLRYGSGDVRGRPCEVALQLGEAMTLRGWAGTVETCPHCRAVPRS